MRRLDLRHARTARLRASDDERERVAREIREHYAAGRLDDDELNERVEAAYAARTQSELNALRADLPALPATRTEQRADVAHRRRELERRLLQQSGGAVVPFAICTAIWASPARAGLLADLGRCSSRSCRCCATAGGWTGRRRNSTASRTSSPGAARGGDRRRHRHGRHRSPR